MADYTSVGAHLSVGSDPAPDATANFDLVVLAAKECQHDGDAFPTEVLRCPLTDGGAEPTTAEVKKAQACAERIAWTLEPYRVPWDIARKFEPKASVQPLKPMASAKSHDVETPLLTDEQKEKPKTVLICCEEGMNRSCWLAAMVLVLIGEQRTGKDAREHLQQLRGPRAFGNAGMRRAADAYYPQELEAYRPRAQVEKPVGGYTVR